ncbi:MAG: MotA/TolQ/ExbB proton channel family protein [Acidobacteriota bacterium]
MSSKKTSRRILSFAGKILLLLIVAAGLLQSGTPASYFDIYGFLFVLVAGLALVMISFPGAEIWRAFRQAASASGSDIDVRNSIHFWEAAGRGFWILGGLSSVLSMIIGFTGMRTVQFASMSALIPMLIRTLLSTFYGCLLAVICFVPCWKLKGILQSRQSVQNPKPDEMAVVLKHPNLRFGAVFGSVLFLFALAVTSHTLYTIDIWPIFRPPFLVVLGGTLALMLFMGGNNVRLTPSAAFAGMGLIGSLAGFIQMLIGMTDPSPHGIAIVAGALAFILFACFTALLGMALIGGPWEDGSFRTGRISSLSAFSRVSWYVFPLLSSIFMVLVFNMIILPLPKA